jgi:hypothetical protein
VIDSPFVALSIADSLLAYVDSSYAFGWILSTTVHDKYTNYFTTARSQIQGANLAGARTTLQTVLAEVDIDSSSTLTSEAYALIRYNTEYLITEYLDKTTLTH